MFQMFCGISADVSEFLRVWSSWHNHAGLPARGSRRVLGCEVLKLEEDGGSFERKKAVARRRERLNVPMGPKRCATVEQKRIS